MDLTLAEERFITADQHLLPLTNHPGLIVPFSWQNAAVPTRPTANECPTQLSLIYMHDNGRSRTLNMASHQWGANTGYCGDLQGQRAHTGLLSTLASIKINFLSAKDDFTWGLTTATGTVGGPEV